MHSEVLLWPHEQPGLLGEHLDVHPQLPQPTNKQLKWFGDKHSYWWEQDKTPLYLNDVFELPDHTDGDHDTWSHH